MADPLVDRFPDLTDDEVTVALAASRVERSELRAALLVANRRELSLAIEAGQRRSAQAAARRKANGAVPMNPPDPEPVEGVTYFDSVPLDGALTVGEAIWNTATDEITDAETGEHLAGPEPVPTQEDT